MKKQLFNEITLLEEETFELGKKIVNKLPSKVGLVIIKGNVGVGKTILVRGIASELGIKENISSPTFGYKNQYDGMTHYDLFLVKKMRSKEFLSLISEELEKNLVVVEWGDKIPKTKNIVIISIKIKKNNNREIKVNLK